jgi:hypothetical protein
MYVCMYVYQLLSNYGLNFFISTPQSNPYIRTFRTAAEEKAQATKDQGTPVPEYDIIINSQGVPDIRRYSQPAVPEIAGVISDPSK